MGLLLLHSDALHMPLADQSVHTAVCSPPYFGLRAYNGLAPTVWPGGEFRPYPDMPGKSMPGLAREALAARACTHDVMAQTLPAQRGANGADGSTLDGSKTTQVLQRTLGTYGTCRHCQSSVACLGNEPTLELYLWHLICILRECWRVLRNDGVLWLVMGDSYTHKREDFGPNKKGSKQYRNRGMCGENDPPRAQPPPGISEGNLSLVPARLALAAQAEGWIVRDMAVWAKTNGMPESVAGWRHTAPRCACVTYRRGTEPYMANTFPERPQRDHDDKYYAAPRVDPDCPTCHGTGFLPDTQLRKGSWRHTRSHETVLMLTKQLHYFSNQEAVRTETGSNPRNVLTPTAECSSVSHFATYPASLIRPLIAVTCPQYACATCKTPWAPVVEHHRLLDGQEMTARAHDDTRPHTISRPMGIAHPRYSQTNTVHGFDPCCTCAPGTGPVPGVCLDPFAGSGTTGLVAQQMGRHAILLEASAAYVQMARTRLGLEDLAAWEGRSGAQTPEDYAALPLFGKGHGA